MDTDHEIEPVNEQVLTIKKASLEQKLHGFGMDIGGTLIKVAYPVYDNDNVNIHLVTYRKEQIEPVLKSLKNSLPCLSEEGAEVFTTGIGCNQFEKLINSALEVKLVNLLEMECNSRAMEFLVKTLPVEDYVFPASEKAKDYVSSQLAGMAKIEAKVIEETAGVVDVWPDKDSNAAEGTNDGNMDKVHRSESKLEVSDVFPSLLCMLGSGAAFCTVDVNGRTNILDVSTSCGKMLLGLGSLLTGAQSYEELISLAEKGDVSTVETLCRHLKSADCFDFYSLLPDDTTMYCYGQAAGKTIADYSREDLAAGLVSQLANSLAECSHHINLLADVKTVFFAGSMCTQSAFIREQISKFYGVKCARNFKAIKRDFHFLKQGAYLGALGALLRKDNGTAS